VVLVAVVMATEAVALVDLSVVALVTMPLDVVAAVARGLKNNTIADCLGISVETVKTHVGNAMDKLGARDRTQMAVTALLYGLIDPLD
jgi:DNA-binding NarL/FixJ family response regulator